MPTLTRPVIRFAALLLIAAPPGVATAQDRPGGMPEPPLVSTVGEAVIEASPDRAWVTVGAESRAGNPRDAQRRNAEAMEPVLARLRAAGVPAEAIRTLGYDLQQEWDYVNDRRVSRGYVARHTVDVRVDDVTRVGELLEIAVGSGATTVNGVRFDLRDRARLEREALRQAVADARARADAAAAGAGMTVERVHRIDVHPSGGGPVPLPRLGMAREVAADAAPPIAAGQIEVRAQVTLQAIIR